MYSLTVSFPFLKKSGQFFNELILQAVLQIRKGSRDISEEFLLFFYKNKRCNPLLELSQRDGSNEGQNICFH